MIGTIPVSEQTVFSYFNSFQGTFPTSDDRRHHALELAGGAEPHTYLTRSVLATLWGDRERVVRENASRLYSLKNTANHYIGQTVLNFVGCSPADISSLKDDTSLLLIDSYLLTPNPEENLSYTFDKPSSSYKDLYGSARALSTNAHLVVTQSQTMMYTPSAGLDVFPLSTGESEKQVLSTTVCLEDNTDLYQGTKHVTDGYLVFGNNEAFKTLRHLAIVAGGVVRERFKEMVTEGEISPDRPLPNLEFLAA